MKWWCRVRACCGARWLKRACAPVRSHALTPAVSYERGTSVDQEPVDPTRYRWKERVAGELSHLSPPP